MDFIKKNLWIIPAAVALIAVAILLVVILGATPGENSGETSGNTTVTTAPATEPTGSFVSTKTLAMPEKTVAFVGQPIVIRFLNVTGYNTPAGMGDVRYKANAGGKGTIYADRWEYTPTQEETVKLELTVLDPKGNVLDAGSVEIEVRSQSQKDKLSVMVIGASTINAGQITQTLLDLADADNYELTLLGTRGTGKNLHEGRGGWTAKRYAVDADNASQNPFWNHATQQFDMSYYMVSANYDGVDCVVMQLGINDTHSAKSDADLEGKMADYFKYTDQLIASIHAYDPNIKIVLDLILPATVDESKYATSTLTAERAKRNTYLTNVKLIEKYKDAENIYVAMTNAPLDTVNNMRDHVHPTNDGYKEIGTTLYSFLRAIN